MRLLNSIRALALSTLMLALSSLAHAQGVARSSAQPVSAALNSAVTVSTSEMQSVTAFYVSGLAAAGATITIEASSDGRNTSDAAKAWFAINATSTGCPVTSFSTVSTDMGFRIDNAGYTDFRLRVSSAGSGTFLASYNSIPSVPLDNGGCGPGGGTTVQTTILTATPSARHFPGCTVGTSSGTCLAAATAQTFIQIENTSSTASVACAWGVAAVLNSATSFQLGTGQSASWGPITAGIPSGALNCISSAGSTPLFVEWN